VIESKEGELLGIKIDDGQWRFPTKTVFDKFKKELLFILVNIL
jgi:hypothetical protein